MTKPQAAKALETTPAWIDKLLKSGELGSLEDKDVLELKEQREEAARLRLEQGLNFDKLRG